MIDLTEQEFSELASRAQLVAELTQHPGWEFFVDRAHATMVQKQGRLVNGMPKTIEEYRGEVGWLAGADWVLKIPGLIDAEVETARGQIQ